VDYYDFVTAKSKEEDSECHLTVPTISSKSCIKNQALNAKNTYDQYHIEDFQLLFHLCRLEV
jgi:hypothetical protein